MPHSRTRSVALTSVAALVMSAALASAQSHGDEHGKAPAGASTPKPTVVGPPSARSKPATTPSTRTSARTPAKPAAKPPSKSPSTATAKPAAKPATAAATAHEPGERTGDAKPHVARASSGQPPRTPRPAATPKHATAPAAKAPSEHAVPETEHTEATPAARPRPGSKTAAARPSDARTAVQKGDAHDSGTTEKAARLSSVRSAINDAVRAYDPRGGGEHAPAHPAPAAVPRATRTPARVATRTPQAPTAPRVPVRWPSRWHEVHWPSPISWHSLTWPDLAAHDVETPADDVPAAPPSDGGDGF